MTPQHPGVKVDEFVRAHGVSKTRLAAQLGMTQRGLHYVLRGDRRVTPMVAARLDAALGFRAETLLAQQAEYDLWQATIALQEYREHHPAAESKQMSFAMTG